ncbi:MAG TPA: phosphoribosyl-ATP diphosphatase [Pirellulaceae bacterium]|jgi:phosphoribosyl-ATP pyrophosphohydrolase|nr:phosphoribosyl-ATP diphosphatase [Pirellulaceae bacterium]
MHSDTGSADSKAPDGGVPGGVLSALMRTIRDRRANPSEKSYTSKLFAGGVPKIGAKVTEEAAEAVEAAGEPGDEGRLHLVREAADVVYHLFVLLAHRDVPLEEVEAELARRFGISGLDEKASRTAPGANVKGTNKNEDSA